MDLSEFLLARIAEDEAAARKTYYERVSALEWRPVEIPNARVLAECEAKRRIVERHADVPVAPGRRELTCLEDGTTSWPCETLRLLALPYADHADYQPEWKP